MDGQSRTNLGLVVLSTMELRLLEDVIFVRCVDGHNRWKAFYEELCLKSKHKDCFVTNGYTEIPALVTWVQMYTTCSIQNSEKWKTL